MVQYKLPMGIQDASHRRGGEIFNEALGNAESTLAGIRKKTSTRIEAYAGMAERLVRDLSIEEALQYEIKDTLEHNNQSYVEWCDLSDKEKITTRLNLLLQMIWAGRRDHMVGDMTPLAGIPSSLVGKARVSL